MHTGDSLNAFKKANLHINLCSKEAQQRRSGRGILLYWFGEGGLVEDVLTQKGRETARQGRQQETPPSPEHYVFSSRCPTGTA
jgi:hypothetical protein